MPTLVVGLGNPGPKYAGHRHNVGFMVVEELARRAGASFKAHKGRADLAETRINEQSVLLAKPKCYMNESGGPVTSLRDYFKLKPEDLVVVSDEIDLPYGRIHVKLGGGDNGHNGLKSLRRSLGTGEFYRVRIGVDRPTGRIEPADWVLMDFSKQEQKELPFHVDRAADAVESLLTAGLVETQQRFHGKATG